ncbi:MAG: DNA polymerase/3'-5' exonuclease PolX [Promethearchaeota archaeon]
MRNRDIVKALYEIADLLELQDVSFKPRAYRRAARSIESLTEDISAIAERGELEQIQGVGEAIAKKIQELLDTGRLQYLEKLREEVPAGLVELLRIPEIGPKTLRVLHEQLGISSVDQLRKAVETHSLRDLPGFGVRSEENIRHNLGLFLKQKKRTFIGKAYPLAQHIMEILQKLSEVERIDVAGSLRRWRETVGDIDILVAAKDSTPIMSKFVKLDNVDRVLVHGVTKSSIITIDGIQVDIRVVKPESFGAALQYFTGSRAHNIALRRLAQQHKWKLSEYALIDTKTEDTIASHTEEEIYKALGMAWIPPELREDTGEIEAALKNRLPKLVKLDDIRGDLHVHTKWSDGLDSIEQMAKAAIQQGYEYLAICDHSSRVRIANGLDSPRLREQIELIRSIDEKLSNFHLLAGVEVEILKDGTLDITDEVLAETDVVVAALHFGTKAPTEKLTERIIKALENEFVDILAHPTGRIINRRPPYSVDLDEIMKVAKRRHVYLEINALERLDLSDVAARQAKNQGLKLVINSDAHKAAQLDVIRYGVAMARRGWLESGDIINTLSFSKLQKTLKHVHVR